MRKFYTNLPVSVHIEDGYDGCEDQVEKAASNGSPHSQRSTGATRLSTSEEAHSAGRATLVDGALHSTACRTGRGDPSRRSDMPRLQRERRKGMQMRENAEWESSPYLQMVIVRARIEHLGGAAWSLERVADCSFSYFRAIPRVWGRRCSS